MRAAEIRENLIAQRMAMDAIENSQDITAMLQKHYGFGASMSELNFGRIFSKKCTEVAVRGIENNPQEQHQILTNYMTTISKLNLTEYAGSLEYFANTVRARSEEPEKILKQLHNISENKSTAETVSVTRLATK